VKIPYVSPGVTTHMATIRPLMPAVVTPALALSLTSTSAVPAASIRVSPLMCTPTRVDRATIQEYGAVIQNRAVDLILWGFWWLSQDLRGTAAMAELENLSPILCPLLKCEARSVSSAMHGQAERVRTLIRAARSACQGKVSLKAELDTNVLLSP